ncbi:MAG: glycosyltransferase family 4 protein [Euryarchaeota archaeon]|nr:glycosyltransferase family 4 protein [Euryarchaeota archaeon]
MKLHICMLLWLRYGEKTETYPTQEILSHLTRFGHSVTWIVSSEEADEIRETTFNCARVFVIPCRYDKNPIKMIIDRASYAIRRTSFILNNFKHERYNIILVRDDLFDGLLALYLQRRYRVPFVFEMSIPVEQSRETRKFYSKRQNLQRIISEIEARLIVHILRNADLILPISRWLGDDLVRKGVDRSKITPLPEGVDPRRFLNRDMGAVAVRDKYGLGDFRIVIYVGTMDKMRHLDVLIHAFSRVRASRGDVKLLMVGDGTGRSDLEKLADKLGIRDDVVFTGYVHFRDVPDFISAANLGISAVPPLDFYKVSSPIKMLEYMAMAKPVVANEEIPDHKEVVGASGGGILVRFDAGAFADGIIELLDDLGHAEEMGRRGRDWVVKNRSYDVIARELENGCLEVLKR